VNPLDELLIAAGPVPDISPDGLSKGRAALNAALSAGLGPSQITESAIPASTPSAARTVDGLATRPSRPRAAVAIAAAVTVAAGALAGAGVFRGMHGTAPDPPAKAHVISLTTLTHRTVAASSGASQADVLYTQVTYAPGVAGPDPIAALQEWDLGLSTREKWFNAQGGLMLDSSDVASGGQREYREVDYTDRTWQGSSYPADQPAQPLSIAEQVGDQFEMSDPKPTITRVQMNGKPMFRMTFQLPAATPPPVGGQRVPGMFPLPMFTLGNEAPGEMYAGPAIQTIWIDADTYLPAQVEMTTPAGQVIAEQTLAWQTPDAANMAELTTVTVPPGFTQTAMPGH
jgi:hypothetical protein